MLDLLRPFLDLSLVLLGIPLVLGPSRRGVFVAVGLCVLTTVAFFLTTLGFHALATSYILGPSFAAWAPLCDGSTCSVASTAHVGMIQQRRLKKTT